ncbi:WbuC family cupin fold metalloprotein [Bacteroides sp.]|uniref:WbuC family cupin fold metalloprotein n=1 Tax=Bacteroides sp. TaxID=29523 RepID=UPI001B4C33BD|nr:WbuC family cupin fold metalloprotein [Bacteroides sp.]MBP6066014.1 WbuC family cupin fold metalloprotein [Bacteroides sp.]MBP6068496.1 WbuC family cupin fold metalloprotein [Bacteroides sp.]MBP6936705.1 WbuC family cupin fold metalloprotein [Bacteroides sp.]MBP8622575.1 WbuC family cupin fold metalloprotein [Bacteroides sp.]MBP9508178.1 WbuC family cupin fold metalloprotein [Bacteroides sp.]
MKLITKDLLDSVTNQAKENPRLRMNYNFHESMDAPIHRMLNALEPGTYLPPHRHKNPDKEEIYLILRGSLMAILFDEEGNPIEKINLDPSKGMYGMEIPAGVWHCIVVLEPGTVIYEIKEGPYAPLTPENLAPWAPDVADKAGAEAFMKRMLTV